MKTGPDFIIIGAMKSATSTLHVQLAAQPGLFMTEPKEPNFFSDDDVWNKGLQWYEGLYAEAGNEDLCGESSTHYSKSPTYPNTVQRIADHVGEATRFIYVMRHPIDRLISHYVHAWSEGVISVDIDTALEKHPELISYSRYYNQLTPYIETFGEDRILPVFFDRLTHRPQEELERICSFIGYDGAPKWNEEATEQNVSSQRMRSTWLLEFLRKIPGSQAFRRQLLPTPVREKIKGHWKIKKQPTLSKENFSRLTEVFDNDLVKLGDKLGLKIDCDNFKQVSRDSPFSWQLK
ncbi:MAG TPA: sulfotransferase [Rhodospirillales bacterium]|nr:sulfotransferase [Rhodospirillales bacterium]